MREEEPRIRYKIIVRSKKRTVEVFVSYHDDAITVMNMLFNRSNTLNVQLIEMETGIVKHWRERVVPIYLRPLRGRFLGD